MSDGLLKITIYWSLVNYNTSRIVNKPKVPNTRTRTRTRTIITMLI